MSEHGSELVIQHFSFFPWLRARSSICAQGTDATGVLSHFLEVSPQVFIFILSDLSVMMCSKWASLILPWRTFRMLRKMAQSWSFPDLFTRLYALCFFRIMRCRGLVIHGILNRPEIFLVGTNLSMASLMQSLKNNQFSFNDISFGSLLKNFVLASWMYLLMELQFALL